MTPISGRPDVKPIYLLAALGVATVAAFILSLSMGPAGLGIDATGEARSLIFTEIRLPRAVLGALVGGALGLSGAALQGYLRNPLAEPSLVGWRCRSAGLRVPQSPCWPWWRWRARTADR